MQLKSSIWKKCWNALFINQEVKKGWNLSRKVFFSWSSNKTFFLVMCDCIRKLWEETDAFKRMSWYLLSLSSLMLYKSLQLWCSRAGQQWFYRRTESGPGKLRIFYSNAASSSSTTLLSSWVGLNFFICFSVVMAAASHHKRQAMVVWWYKRMKIVDPLQGFLLLLTWEYAWLLWWYLACNCLHMCV